MQTITGVFGLDAAQALQALRDLKGPVVSGPGYALAGPPDGPAAVKGGPEGVRASFDESTAQGTLTRDRHGQQPLYLLRQAERLWFSSDLRTLLRVPGYRPTLHLEALHHFLSYQEVPSPLTLFAGITRVGPAHRQHWRDGRLPTAERYWRLDWRAVEHGDAEHAEKILDNLRAALDRRPLDTFLLSGDAESALLVALAREGGRSLRTVTVRRTSAQAERARRLAQQLGTEHVEMAPLPLEDALRRQVAAHGEPRLRSLLFLESPLPHAVSGLGGKALLGSRVSRELTGQPEASEDWWQRYQLLTFTDEEKERLYDPRMLEELQGFSSLQLVKRRYSHLSATDPWNRSLEADLGAFDGQAHLADELFCPFLDESVSPLLACAPVSLKRSHGLLTRLGQGLAPGSGNGCAPQGVAELAESWLSSHELEKVGLFSPASVNRLKERTRARDPRATRQLLTLLSFQAWHRHFLEAPALVH